MVRRKLAIDEALWNRFVCAVKRKNKGKKWGKISEKINELIKNELEYGELQFYDVQHKEYKENQDILEELTTADVEKEDPTINFLKAFDNHHLIYPRFKLDIGVIQNVVKEITGKKTNYTWRKYSKILKNNNRMVQVKGMPAYYIKLSNFKYKENKSDDVFKDAAKWMIENSLERHIGSKEVIDKLHCKKNEAKHILNLIIEKIKTENIEEGHEVI